MTELTPYQRLERMAEAASPLVGDPNDRLMLTAGFEADPISMTLELVPNRPGELYDPARARRIVPEAKVLSRLRDMADAFRDADIAHAPEGQSKRTLLTVTLTISADGAFSVGMTSLDAPVPATGERETGET